MRTAEIKEVLVLSPGDTPWDYESNPGSLPGPWGDTVEEALSNLEEETDLQVEEYWDTDGALWVVTAAKKNKPGVWDLPPGWTEASARSFWKSMGESVTKCAEKLKDKEEISNPGAFCATLKDRTEGTAWRHEPRKSSTEELLDFVYDTGKLLTASSLDDDDFKKFGLALSLTLDELEDRGAARFGEQALEESGFFTKGDISPSWYDRERSESYFDELERSESRS